MTVGVYVGCNVGFIATCHRGATIKFMMECMISVFCNRLV